MKKFIFTFALVTIMGAFASCGNSTKGSTTVDSLSVDTTIVDSVDTVVAQ